MQFYPVSYTTTVTIEATNTGESTIDIGDQTIKIIVSGEETFQDVYVGAGQSTEVTVKSASKYNDAVLYDENELKVIAASSKITIGAAADSDSLTEGTYVLQDQRSNQFAKPENRYYTDQIVHKNDFAGRDVITESSLDNAGLYEFIANEDGTYAVKTGDHYLKTTGFTMDMNGATGLISSVSWTDDPSKSAVKFVKGTDGTVGLYTTDASGANAMMASWGGYQYSMWANYASPEASSGSALRLYPASVTTTLNVSAQTAGDYEIVFEDTVLRIHVVDAVRVPVEGSVTVDCDGVSGTPEIPKNLEGYITCKVNGDKVTFTNNNVDGLEVGDILTGTVMIGDVAFSVSIGIDEEIDMAKGGTKEIAYKDGTPTVSTGLELTTTKANKAVLVTDITDIQDGGEYLIAGMRVQTVAGDELATWAGSSRDVSGLKKLTGTPVANDTTEFKLTGYDAARVRFDKVGENTYTLYNVSAGKYLTGSSFNLGLTARKSEASAMTVTARATTAYGAGLVSIGTGGYEIGDWGGYWSNGFTMIPANSNGTELKLFAAVDSIATITAEQTGTSYVTVGSKTYKINVFDQTAAAASIGETLYPTVSAAVKDAKVGNTIVLKNTSETETVAIPVGVTVQYGNSGEEKSFKDASYQVKDADGKTVAEIPVKSENGKAILFLPSSAPEVTTLTAENLNLGDAVLSIVNGEATATLKVGEVTLTKTFTAAKAGNVSAIFISDLKEDGTSKAADINWINTSKSNVGVDGKLAKVDKDGKVTVSSGVKKMKGRGNTSWGAAVDGNAATDKKPYNITLDGKEILVDGSNKAKKWCLIANNYSDFSGVNNYMAYTMYQEINGNSAMHAEPVDLYVDGEYRGIYLVTDKVEIGEKRVNVPESKYTTKKDAVESQEKVIVDDYDTHFDASGSVEYWKYAKSGAAVTSAANDDALKAGVLAYAYAAEQTQETLNGGYVLEVSHQYTDEAGWFITNHGVMISFKEPERPTKKQVQAAAIYVQQFEDALYSETGYNSLGKHYSEYLDIDSFTKTYLLSCFTGQNDFLDCSDYLNLTPTYDADDKITGGKLMGGPAWDYDVSSYSTDKLYADKVSTNVNGNQAWISQLLKHGDFTDALYKLKTGAFADAVTSMKNKVVTYGENVAASLAMDQLMWNRTTSAQQQYDTQKTNFLKRAETTWDAVWNAAALKGVSVAVNEETGEIVATVNAANATYQWYKLNKDKTTATACADATNATFTPSEAGTYFVAVTGTKMNGKDVPATMISAAVEFEGHSYSTDWSHDGTNHWHDCTVSGHNDKTGMAPHTYDQEVATKAYLASAATCAKKAVYYKSCVCGAKGTETFEYGDYAEEHTLTHHDAVPATCEADGTVEYWSCSVCGKNFSDADGKTVIESIVVPKTGHTMTKTEAKAATCTEDGNNAYYTCSVCHKVFKDEDGTQETTIEAETIAKLTRPSSGGSSSSSGSYAVSAPSVKNGDVSVSPKNAKKGDTVTVTVTPDKGYELDTITVKDASGNSLKLTDKGDGKYTFTMPGSKVTVSAAFAEVKTAPAFADVPVGAYYTDAVKWAVEKGITNGKANGLFGSNDPCTRGQIVTFLWRAAGSPVPKGTAKVPADVAPGSYCYDAVAWALENGVAKGLSDGSFGVNNPCTRAQCVTFLFRNAAANGMDAVTLQDLVSSFGDAADLPGYAVPAMNWALSLEIVQGNGGLLMPNGTCTRAQIVTFLYRAAQGK